MDLRLTFGDIRDSVTDYLGIGLDWSSLIEADQDKVDKIIYRAYRNFLYPVNLRTGKVHVWSWLKKEATLTLEDGVWEYDLPSDFKRLIRPLLYSYTDRHPPINKVSVSNVMQFRTYHDSGSFPVLCAVIPEDVEIDTAQIKKIIFTPTPDQEYVVNYSYISIPSAPEESTDYFLGDAVISETILQGALAVAEQQEDEKMATQTQLYLDMVNRMVQDDVPSAPDSVGILHDGNLNGASSYLIGYITRKYGNLNIVE